MAIDFVESIVDNKKTWVATKTVGNETAKITVYDTDGDQKLDNHDYFTIEGKLSVFKSSELKQALAAKYHPSTEDTTNDPKTGAPGYKYADVEFTNKEGIKTIKYKQGEKYNVGSLFNNLPNPKTASNANANAGAGNSSFSQFDISQMGNNFGLGGYGGLSGGIGDSAFTFNPSAVPGLNMMASTAASALAGYCTSPIDSISATSFGAALPGWFTRFFADPTTAYGINNSQNMPFLTASAFAKKWSGTIDLKKPIDSTTTTSTSTSGTTSTSTSTDEVTFDDGTTPVADPENKDKKLPTKGHPVVTENYDGKGATRYDYHDGSAKIVLADGSIQRIHKNAKGEKYCEFYDKNDKYIKTVTYHADKTRTVTNTPPSETKDADSAKAQEAKEKVQKEAQEEATDIAGKLWNALDGIGTANKALKTQLGRITKDNVLEVMKSYQEEYGNGESLVQAILDDNMWGSEDYVNPLKEALAAKAKEMGLGHEAAIFSNKVDHELNSNWVVSSNVAEYFQDMYKKMTQTEENK